MTIRLHGMRGKEGTPTYGLKQGLTKNLELTQDRQFA